MNDLTRPQSNRGEPQLSGRPASLVVFPKAVDPAASRIDEQRAISARTLDLIDTAAAGEGKSRTEFMVQSARLHAINVLLDQRLFTLDPDQTTVLAEVLATPPKANEALRDLMCLMAPWT